MSNDDIKAKELAINQDLPLQQDCSVQEPSVQEGSVYATMLCSTAGRAERGRGRNA